MITDSERALSLVENSNFILLREISAVKKTCCFNVEWANRKLLVEFKFGQLVGVYLKSQDIKQVLLDSLIEGAIVSPEMAYEFGSSNLTTEAIFETLETLDDINLSFIKSLKENFYLELISEVLFSTESKYFHVAFIEFERLLGDKHVSLLSCCNLSEISIGQVILNTYKLNKNIDNLYVNGNCLTLKEGRSFELSNIIGFDDNNIPLDEVILSGVGLRTFAIMEIQNALQSEDVEIHSVEFALEEEMLPVSDSGMVQSQEVGLKDVPTPSILSLKSIFQEPQASARLIEFISIVGLAILLFRGFTFFDSVYGAFLDMQPL